MRVLHLKRKKKYILNDQMRERDRKASAFREQLVQCATPAELAFKAAIEAKGWKYTFQCVAVAHRKTTLFFPDFRLWPKSGRRLYVEIDGGYHKSRVEYDARRTKWLEENKHADVVRFTNDEVFTDLPSVLAKLESYEPCPPRSAKRSEIIRQPITRAERHQPGSCVKCRAVASTTKVVTYKNGAQHRVWWCEGCERQVGGNPVPRNTVVA